MTQTKAQLIDGKTASIEFDTGSASAPTISFTGDTDTGLYSPGANELAISTNGTGRLFVDSTGKVGLGTSAPGAKLTVAQSAANADTDGIRIIDSGATTRANLYYRGSQVFEINSASNPGGADVETLRLSTVGNARLSITRDGRVGVGSTAPQSPLHVNGSGDVAIQITNGSTGTGATDGSQITVEDPSMDLVLRNRENATIRFLTANTERGRWDASGRLLVGTSSGSALLQVNGTFRAGSLASSGLDGNNAVILSATPPSGTLAAEIHCFGKDYATAGANNHTGLLIAYWSADTNRITTTTDINHSTGSNQGFQVIWSSPNLIVRNKTSMSAVQSSRAWIRWLA